MVNENKVVTQYFDALEKAFDGLDMYLREDDSPLYKHDIIGSVVASYLSRMGESLASWKNRVAFTERFRISRSESGFPVFQNVLELEKDRLGAKKRLATLPDDSHIREEMVEYILKKKEFPTALQKTMSERRYLETLINGVHFSPIVLPQTIRVSVNPKTGRPYYVVHWGAYDGSENLPMVYMATIEDSSPDLVETLVTKKNRLNKKVDIPLPVEGLLNPKLARQFDDFCEKNSSYGLTLSTIATNMDRDFEHLHPKQLRRFVLGPFYHTDITEHGHKVDKILQKVKRPENAWLLTWTLQELYSYNEIPAKWGLWSDDPAREEFFINTDNLDCARQGVSAFQRHALVPHEAYQAIYAAGEENEIFEGFQKHIISGEQVLRNM